MARTLTPAIPPKMYRHFALVTVGLTVGIAMFASGESREAMAAHVEEQQQQHELELKSREKAVAPTIARRIRPRSHGFSSDSEAFGGTFGRPMIGPAIRANNVDMDEVEGASQEPPTGYSQQYLDTLSEEERKLLLASQEKERSLTPEERQRRNASLIAASQVRSGGARTDD